MDDNLSRRSCGSPEKAFWGNGILGVLVRKLSGRQKIKKTLLEKEEFLKNVFSPLAIIVAKHGPHTYVCFGEEKRERERVREEQVRIHD